MTQFWALWLFSLVLRGIGLMGLGMTLITACIASAVPFVGVLWLFYGGIMSLTVYGAGQFILLMMSIHDSSRRTSDMLRTRRRPSPPPDIEYEQEVDPAPRPMGYSRRYRPAPPEVPQDDPRRVRTYRREPIVRDAPEERIPRPRPRG